MKQKFGLWPIFSILVLLATFVALQTVSVPDVGHPGISLHSNAVPSDPFHLLPLRSESAERAGADFPDSCDVPVAYAQVSEPVDSGDSSGGLWGFLKDNWAVLIPALLGVVEVIVRLTPSEKDNSIFSFIKFLLDKIIPNARAGGGTHP